jgi:hypothetical protein
MAGDLGCVQKCAALVDTKLYNAAADFGSGDDTLACRIAHLSAATYYAVEGMTMLRDAHCSHSGIRSKVQCDYPEDKAPDCDAFCKMVTNTCSGANAVYETREQCLGFCQRLTPGKSSDTMTPGTLRCLREGAYDALEGSTPAIDCPKASVAGDGCTGGRCQAYCSNAKTACPAQFQAAYPTNTETECQTKCAGMAFAPANSPFSVTSQAAFSGDNLQCRLLRLTRFLSGMDTSASVCAAALGLPGSACTGS